MLLWEDIHKANKHSLAYSCKSEAKTMSRSTLFTASQPSQRLPPYTPRPPPSPPSAHPKSLSRSSSLRSEKVSSSAEDDCFSPAIPPIAKLDAEPARFSSQSPAGYSNRNSSLSPRLLPSALHPRRKSWFREDDPSAFGPPSPDPAALSPMATFLSSMSEDEQRDELFSETSSRSSASWYSLSSLRQYHDTTKVQERSDDHQRSDTDYRPFSIVDESSFLTLPARARSDSYRSDRSNPSVIVNAAYDGPDMPRRSSEGGCESTRILYHDN